MAKQAFKKSLPPDESNEHLFPGLDHLHAVDGLAKEASLRLTRILAPFQNQDSSRSCVEKNHVRRLSVKEGLVQNAYSKIYYGPSDCLRGDPFITFTERGRGGVEKLDQNANAVREVA